MSGSDRKPDRSDDPGSAAPPIAPVGGEPAPASPAEQLPRTLAELAALSCRHESNGLPPDVVARLAVLLPGWTVEGSSLIRQYGFADFHQTMAFVNAVAWVAHRQDHHPELAVGYGRCQVVFTTHSAGGLTRNDFICAARVEALAWQG